jgi:hypothetical protein
MKWSHRIVEGKTDMRVWWLDLHNAVNQRGRKSAWTAEAVTATYGGLSDDVIEAALTELTGVLAGAGVAALRGFFV